MRRRAIILTLALAFSPTLNASDLNPSGSFRIRYESLDGQVRSGVSSNDQQLAIRTTARLDYTEGTDNTSLFGFTGELIDARVFLDDSGSRIDTTMVNKTELVQAHITFKSGAYEFLMGRYTLDLGSRRLLGRNNYRNSTNAFSGFLARLRPDDSRTVTAFLNFPARIDPDANDRRDRDLRFGGIHVADSGLLAGFDVEYYGYLLKERDGRDIKTFGMRALSAPAIAKLDSEIELVYQTGHRNISGTGLDVFAHLLRVAVGYSINDHHRIQIALDTISGDKSVSDDEYNRFDTLFGPSVPDFGFTGLYGAVARANLISPELRWQYKLGRFDSYVSWRPLWVAEIADSFGRSGQRSVNGDTFVGHQFIGNLRYWILPKRVSVESGIAVLLDDGFLEANLPGYDRTLYGYSTINVIF